MDLALSMPVLIGLIITALIFDFLNGLHDAANSIATIVSTRVLRPQHAVVWAAVFNFIAAFVKLPTSAIVTNALRSSVGRLRPWCRVCIFPATSLGANASRSM